MDSLLLDFDHIARDQVIVTHAHARHFVLKRIITATALLTRGRETQRTCRHRRSFYYCANSLISLLVSPRSPGHVHQSVQEHGEVHDPVHVLPALDEQQKLDVVLDAHKAAHQSLEQVMTECMQLHVDHVGASAVTRPHYSLAGGCDISPGVTTH